MNRIVPAFFVAALTAGCADTAQSPTTSMKETYTPVKVELPETRKDEVVDTLWNTAIADPYRWLEDDNDPEVLDWVQRQNKATRTFLDDIPFRDALRERYAELYNYEKVSSPYRVGEHYFIYRNDGLQNQAVIYVRKGRDGEDRVFIDPNTLSEDGTVTASLLGASEDHRFMAISRSEAGSDWSQIRVIDIESGEETGDVLKWVKLSGAAWYKDGFFYSRYPEPKEGAEYSGENTFHSVYYHKLGTPQDEDELIYRNPDAPNMYHYGSVTEDNRYFILYKSTGTDGYETHFMDLNDRKRGIRPLFTGFENKSSVIDHVDGKLLVITDIDAPNYRLIAVDPIRPDRAQWEEIIPESEHLLEGANTAGGKLFATYLENASTRVYVMNTDGSERKAIELPDGTGTAGGFGGKKDYETVFYTFTSFTYPTSIYEYNIASGESMLFSAPDVKFEPSEYVSKQVFFTSKDGTQVPMFIVHKKGLEPNGEAPTYLYGYGGFNVSLTPAFNVSNLVLLENGGVYAMVNLRGGGEFGEDWHRAGMLLKKQNVFDDFIAAAEYLIDEGYTHSGRLAIAGGSNGGLLVGAAMTQRPELFQVAFPAVGVMDMLRYHKFTVGWGWIPEYGCADSTEVHFKNLLAYSPLHNLKEGTAYPATMVTTADHDDRVVPAHSFKFAARLQAAHAGDAPVLIRIDERAGHGAGKPTSKILDEQADRWAFMFANMGIYPGQ